MENDQVYRILVCHGIKADLSVGILGYSRRPLRPPEVRGYQYVAEHLRPKNVNTGLSLDRLITSKDHASVQISIVDVDANGLALGTSTSFALCGQVRSQGESDDSINRLATKEGRELVCFVLHTMLALMLLQSCGMFGLPRNNCCH
jgi:hypothetical protein